VELAQIIWLIPASASVGPSATTKDNVSVEDAQPALLIVQTKEFNPIDKPVTVAKGLLMFARFPEPVKIDHVPFPTIGVFPIS
jgi:hypothetical protein